ncbi:MAG: hypothetical protein F6K54_40480 [Okeania sp. SIO3B5]|nr:hypothetical protein [Okeania sp. SIO3B5]
MIKIKLFQSYLEVKSLGLKKEEGRNKKEEGRRKKEEIRRKKWMEIVNDLPLRIS